VANCSEFYRRRDMRTEEYLSGVPLVQRHVHVSMDDQAARSRAGQVAALSLANQLARVHRTVTFSIPCEGIPLLIPSRIASHDLSSTILRIMAEIDPCGVFSLAKSCAPDVLSIGLGEHCDGACNWFIGAHNSIATLSRSPQGFSESAGTIRGAALSSCLGAAALFRTQLKVPTSPRRVSAWNYREGDSAADGPSSLDSINVGRVLMLGAGAVGGSLAYWLRLFGVEDQWTIVDADKVKIHNLNRTLLFTAADAGWPDGEERFKSQIVADSIPSAIAEPTWYHDYSSTHVDEFDVVLCLANEHDVRHEVACRNFSVVLHATTGTDWLSQLHRHVAGIDDCIFCRVGEIKPVEFGCSTVQIPGAQTAGTDAALPFLSAASGLMLATLLQRLQSGELLDDDCNDWRWDFGSAHRMASAGKRFCGELCSRVSPEAIRQKLHKSCRWKHLERS